MAISIDTVYQKVLALANKEQRGYITPQEFNLLADKAQKDIFESYFNLDSRKLDKKNLDGDDLDLLPEKIQKFYTDVTESVSTSWWYLPDNLHKLHTVHSNGVALNELTKKEILYTENNPLTKATTSRRVYVRDNDKIIIYPKPSSTSITVTYWKNLSTTPNWGYVVVNGKALFNANTSTNFQIHDSEEEMLVTRILELAGVVIEKPQLQQTAMVEKAQLKQEQIR
jgi:hypothetical protein